MANLRVKLILNPIAGKGTAAQRLPQVESLFRQRGLSYTLFLTKAPGHAIELARAARVEGYGLVVAAGGDGTVNEVTNGLMESGTRIQDRPAIAVLSIGRGNDFCYGADIPASLEDCVAAISAGVSRPLDVGRIAGGDYPDGRYFANGIGVGFDTIVGLEAAKMKHVHGFMAYVFGALRTFILYPMPPHVRLESSAAPGRAVEMESSQISIMNGKRMGGTFFMAPRASNFDGCLDLCMAAKLNRSDMIHLMADYTKGTQYRNPKIITTRSPAYSIKAPSGGLVVHADGETITTNGTALEISCLPSALRIIYDPAVAAARSVEFAGIPVPGKTLP